MTFYVGQKVQCIKRGEWMDNFRCGPNRPTPAYGQVVTVRDVVVMSGRPIGLRFVEIVRPKKLFVRYGEFEPDFDSRRFIPLQESGMSMLRAILTNPKRELELTE